MLQFKFQVFITLKWIVCRSFCMLSLFLQTTKKSSHISLDALQHTVSMEQSAT